MMCLLIPDFGIYISFKHMYIFNIFYSKFGDTIRVRLRGDPYEKVLDDDS